MLLVFLVLSFHPGWSCWTLSTFVTCAPLALPLKEKVEREISKKSSSPASRVAVGCIPGRQRNSGTGDRIFRISTNRSNACIHRQAASWSPPFLASLVLVFAPRIHTDPHCIFVTPFFPFQLHPCKLGTSCLHRKSLSTSPILPT